MSDCLGLFVFTCACVSFLGFASVCECLRVFALVLGVFVCVSI